MGKIRAVLCGYYGKGNGGDEALLAALLQMLPSPVIPVVLSGNPQQTRDRYGVESCDRFSSWAVFQALRTSQVLIWGGGSLMQDATSWVSPLYYAGVMALAQQFGLKTIAWGQGIGPLKRPITREVTKRVLQGCAAVSVRDRASARQLADWQIDFLLAPDPVWALDARPAGDLEHLPCPKIAINLRSHPQLTPQRLTRLTQALIHLQQVTEAAFVFVPFQLTQDLEIARAIAAQLPGSSQVVALEDPRQLKGLFENVEMTIGMRLHSLIMAAAKQCRCSALSYDPKVSQLMEELQLPGWELSALPDDPQEISQGWLKVYAQGQPLSPEQIQSLSDRALMHQELLRRVLG